MWSRADPSSTRLRKRGRGLGQKLPGLSVSPEASETLQVLDEVALLPRGQPEAEARVVVLDHRAQRREAAVVPEAALGVRKEALQRRRAVHAGRRAVGLEGLRADLGRPVEVLARRGEERRGVA